PSSLLDPLDLGPTPLGGVTGLVEAARCGDVEIFNPLGAGLLENPELRSALPDLCRQLFHEDLLLRPAEPDLEPAGWLSMDPAGGDELVERPMVLRLLVMGTEDGYEVLPGGVGVTADDGPETLKDVWVTVPETSTVPAEGESGPGAAEQAPTTARGVLTAYPAMTRSIGSDLFWFGRYLERVDSTARLLRAVLDTVNDLDAERGPGARTAQAVLLGAVTDVTTTYPGFPGLDLDSPRAVSEEIESLLTHRGRPGTLAQSYAALTHTTRTLRDLISDDIWPVIARMNQRLRSLGGQDVQPVEQRLTDIVDGCLTLSGAVADSMPRNLGWDLTEAGRKIERTMSLLALLRGALGHRRTRAAEARIAGAVALVTESGASYRRSYHAAIQPELLLELLLTAPPLPRSIAFQLDRLGQALDRLPDVTPSPELRAPLIALRSRISGWEARELLSPLGGEAADGAPTALLEEADAAMDTLRELATALENRFFHPSESTSRWGIDDV
ncbi:MAG: circularly permuted type 2 ATP-grasp protein, partial [Brachybacterium sp.]|nr:circularly permuted type 2 ATP-grasp protein [Brachybacterium sp.]